MLFQSSEWFRYFDFFPIHAKGIFVLFASVLWVNGPSHLCKQFSPFSVNYFRKCGLFRFRKLVHFLWLFSFSRFSAKRLVSLRSDWSCWTGPVEPVNRSLPDLGPLYSDVPFAQQQCVRPSSSQGQSSLDVTTCQTSLRFSSPLKFWSWWKWLIIVVTLKSLRLTMPTRHATTICWMYVWNHKEYIYFIWILCLNQGKSELWPCG